MYTTINWALDLDLYVAVCAITYALWWWFGRRGEPGVTAGCTEALTDSIQSVGQVNCARLTVVQVLPLAYRRSKQTSALPPREESPNTPATAGVPAVAVPASLKWRLPCTLPLVWTLYVAGLLVSMLPSLLSDPAAACTAIIHWNNYTPFGSFMAVANQFRDGESPHGTLYALLILPNIALFVPPGSLVGTTWCVRRMWRAPEGMFADGSRLVQSTPYRHVLTWVVIGYAVFYLIELTQYTGLFGVVPCIYRVVDIDDIIMNTLGTYAGVCLLPSMTRNSCFMGTQPPISTM